tara:strand:+ start:548 stop:685 length:138 start_codon:yes stop_codon:yes gene_type:complete
VASTTHKHPGTSAYGKEDEEDEEKEKERKREINGGSEEIKITQKD